MAKSEWPKGVRTDYVLNGWSIYDPILRKRGAKLPEPFIIDPAGREIQLHQRGSDPEAKKQPLRSIEELTRWLKVMHMLASSFLPPEYEDHEGACEIFGIATADAVKWLEFFANKPAAKPSSTGRTRGGQRDPDVQKRNSYLRSIFRRDPKITPADLRESAAAKCYLFKAYAVNCGPTWIASNVAAWVQRFPKITRRTKAKDKTMTTLMIPVAVQESGTGGLGNATIIEAAEFLRLSKATVYILMDRGDLTYCRFGRARRIPWRELVRFSEAAMIGGNRDGMPAA